MPLACACSLRHALHCMSIRGAGARTVRWLLAWRHRRYAAAMLHAPMAAHAHLCCPLQLLGRLICCQAAASAARQMPHAPGARCGMPLPAGALLPPPPLLLHAPVPAPASAAARRSCCIGRRVHTATLLCRRPAARPLPHTCACWRARCGVPLPAWCMHCCRHRRCCAHACSHLRLLLPATAAARPPPCRPPASCHMPLACPCRVHCCRHRRCSLLRPCMPAPASAAAHRSCLGRRPSSRTFFF